MQKVDKKTVDSNDYLFPKPYTLVLKVSEFPRPYPIHCLKCGGFMDRVSVKTMQGIGEDCFRCETCKSEITLLETKED